MEEGEAAAHEQPRAAEEQHSTQPAAQAQESAPIGGAPIASPQVDRKPVKQKGAQKWAKRIAEGSAILEAHAVPRMGKAKLVEFLRAMGVQVTRGDIADGDGGVERLQSMALAELSRRDVDSWDVSVGDARERKVKRQKLSK